jgi:hypothetical protein
MGTVMLFLYSFFVFTIGSMAGYTFGDIKLYGFQLSKSVTILGFSGFLGAVGLFHTRE